MLEELVLGFSTQAWIAQLSDPAIGNPAINTPEDAALIFSGPRFFIALVAGLVLAFGFQLLLTNLSVAAGISYLGGHGESQSDHSSRDAGGGVSVKKIGTAVGLWTLLTVTIALFVACLLAVKLSLINNALLGAIVGLVIWGTYFTLLVWLSSTTVGSLVGSVVNAAVSGFQSIIGTATAALGAKTARDQMISTAQAAASAVRQELTTGIDPISLRENVEDYLSRLRPAELDLKSIREGFEQLLNDPELKSADPETLRSIDRQAFVDLVSSRSNLSQRDVNRVVDQLEAAWNKAIGRSNRPSSLDDVIDFLRSAKPDQLAKGLDYRLDQLIDLLRQQQGQQAQPPGGMAQVFNALMGVLLGRMDLSDLDVEKVLGQLKQTRDRVTVQADKLKSAAVSSSQPEPHSVIRADVENYLLNTYSWEMTPARINEDFREVLYDPTADAGTIRRELEQFGRPTFVELLQSRGVFTQEQIQKLATLLERIRLDVLQKVAVIEETHKSEVLRTDLDRILRSAPRETLLNGTALSQVLRPILDDPEADPAQLQSRFALYNQPTIAGMMNGRPDLSTEEKAQIAASIDRIANEAIADARGLREGVRTRVSNQWQQVGAYLSRTGKEELNPEGIKRDLQTLLHDPQAGIHDLRERASHFDRETLVQLLRQRNDLTDAEAEHIVDRVEANWYRATHVPQIVAHKATEQYDRVVAKLSDYLRNTGREELNPEGINRDLKLLLQDPQAGTTALRDRLSHVDRETLVKLLSQRQDMSEEEVNQVINQVMNSIRQIVGVPRRLAVRTQNKVRDFRSTLSDYLRNTGKEELNPEGIERDLKTLLSDPRLGAGRLADRLSHVDRSTVVALLSQREDITPEEANRIVDQVLSVRTRLMEQVQAMQQQIQAVIDSIFRKIRNYLNALERPELNYDSIKQDIRTLFDDPQAGFDALRHRLSQFDRQTLVALLSSREDISKEQAERIIDQVERARNSVLQRAERVQTEVQRRMDDMKLQVQRQAEETRKAAATAAWWLFGTALTSAFASALAGSLAVAG